jgi:dipeptidyl aminopeptidase/acylaminoacyl peptidase
MRRKFPVAFVGACIGTLTLASAAHAGFPGAEGKIAFQTNRDGNYEIYEMNGDGTAQTRITNNAATDVQPAWSPDGTKIAFTSNRDGNDEIYVMNADGSGQTRITNNAASDAQPGWSPDGTKIVFATSRDGSTEIYTMNSDGSGQTRITNNSSSDNFPVWSPDGAKIAFQSHRDGNWEIYTMNPDGSGQTNLTNNPAYDELPEWTSTGAQLYFDSDREGDFQIFSMNSDGANVARRAGFTNAPDYAPAVSPRNTLVWTAFDGDYELYLYGGGGGGLGLTRNNADDSYPDWQPVNRTYARPKGATPTRISLAPAYKQCSSPTTSHRGSISAGSCYAPTPESDYLTVGTPDYNGQAANYVGSVLLKVRATAPEDGTITVSNSDVRCQRTSAGCPNGPLSDYADDLLLETTFRITDKGNGQFTTGPSTNGTVTDLPAQIRVPCTVTSSTTIGSSCSVTTSINTLFGSSAIVAGQRAIWQLSSDVNLYDGGADGVATTTADNMLFATGGLFFP